MLVLYGVLMIVMLLVPHRKRTSTDSTVLSSWFNVLHIAEAE